MYLDCIPMPDFKIEMAQIYIECTMKQIKALKAGPASVLSWFCQLSEQVSFLLGCVFCGIWAVAAVRAVRNFTSSIRSDRGNFIAYTAHQRLSGGGLL